MSKLKKSMKELDLKKAPTATHYGGFPIVSYEYGESGSAVIVDRFGTVRYAGLTYKDAQILLMRLRREQPSVGFRLKR